MGGHERVWQIIGQSPPYGIARHVADCVPFNGKANANLIVRAVNAHDEIVAVLKALQNYLEYLPGLLEEAQMSGHAGNCTILARQCRAALAKAKGE